jgi:hypothetical protein
MRAAEGVLILYQPDTVGRAESADPDLVPRHRRKTMIQEPQGSEYIEPREDEEEGPRGGLLRPIGWGMFGVGVGIWIGVAIWTWMTSPAALLQRAATAGVLIGLLLLVASVTREQVSRWFRDPYRRVKR